MNEKGKLFIVRAAALVAFIGSLAGCLSQIPAAHAGAAEVLFEEPALNGVEGNFFVPPVLHKAPPPGRFTLVLWQPNPNRPDGMLVPTEWAAGDKTGFNPSNPVAKHQAGFRDVAGTSTVQADGDTVGAYLNSADLPGGSHKNKMMIAPAIRLAPEAQVHPFAQAGRAVLVSLELQVPTAVDAHNGGSSTHVNADLGFVDPGRGTKINYGCNLFFNGHPRRRPGGNIAFDQDSQNMMIDSAVGLERAWLTLQPGSAVSQSSPWKGWKAFVFAITEKNFAEALAALNEREPGIKASVKPADYTFVQFHLNAELHFQSAPAELGWSMRHVKIAVVDAALMSQ